MLCRPHGVKQRSEHHVAWKQPPIEPPKLVYRESCPRRLKSATRAGVEGIRDGPRANSLTMKGRGSHAGNPPSEPRILTFRGPPPL